MGIDISVNVGYGFMTKATDEIHEEIEDYTGPYVHYTDMDCETVFVGVILGSTGSMRWDPPDMNTEIDPTSLHHYDEQIIKGLKGLDTLQGLAETVQKFKIYAYTEYS